MSNEKKNNGVIVSGFEFYNAAEAKQAQKEEAGVKYIQEKIDMDEPEVILQIYNKMVEQNLFETAVGYSYLKQLQDYLKMLPGAEAEKILPIFVQHPALEKNLLGEQNTKMRSVEQNQDGQFTEVRGEDSSRKSERLLQTDYKKKFQVAAFFCGILAICVVAMFAITATADSPTILNYETKLINRYEKWEQELSEREAAVSQKEEELGIGED